MLSVEFFYAGRQIWSCLDQKDPVSRKKAVFFHANSAFPELGKYDSLACLGHSLVWVWSVLGILYFLQMNVLRLDEEIVTL